MNTGAKTAGLQSPRDIYRLMLAGLLPLAAFGLQWFFWAAIQPYVWFLFFPAVFFSSSVGGLRGGLVATALSTGLVWYFFIPPQFSFAVQSPMAYVSIAMFMGMGVLFSVVHDRLHRANAQVTEALTAVRSANDRLETEVRKRTAELEQAGRAVRESEERFRLMVEGVQDYAIILLDADGCVANWNAGAARIKGYRADEIIGQHFSRFYPAEEVARGKPAMELETAATTGRFEDEGWRVRKDGSRFWANVIITALRDKAGALRGFAKITRDITARRQAEEEIRELNTGLERRVAERTAELQAANASLADFKAALDQHAIVAITDAAGTITYVNDKFCLISKYAREELLGQNHRLINSGHHPKDFFRTLWRTIGSGRVWNGEIRNRAKDGSFYWMDTTIVPFLDAHGKPAQYIAIRTDITGRKQAAERIEQLNADLQNRAGELEATNQELAAFSYSVSHDLRSPLRGIDGFSQALEEDYADKFDDTGRSHLARVRAAAQRMSGLIDDLLKLSKITRAELRRQPVDLSALARTVAAELHRREPARQVQWAIADGLAAEGDPSLLRVALDNLLGNAWKFAGKRPDARIEFGRGQRDGQTAFFVRDNGAGFDMAHAKKLFGAFQRLHTRAEFEGTGIGLATVQRIVHRHGGRVWAEGEVERGATFYFTL